MSYKYSFQGNFYVLSGIVPEEVQNQSSPQILSYGIGSTKFCK